VCLFITNAAQTQAIENVVFEFDGERISITYDLNYKNTGQKFTISLYSSHNNYQKPITLLTGDVGDNILPGKRKKVMWDVRNELPPYFDDEISIKVKAILIEVPTADIVPALGYQIQPLKSIAYKRGSEIKIQWEGGASGDRIKIDLLKNNVLQQTLTQTNNTNSYLWEIPKNYKTGKSYNLRIRKAYFTYRFLSININYI